MDRPRQESSGAPLRKQPCRAKLFWLTVWGIYIYIFFCELADLIVGARGHLLGPGTGAPCCCVFDLFYPSPGGTSIPGTEGQRADEQRQQWVWEPHSTSSETDRKKKNMHKALEWAVKSAKKDFQVHLMLSLSCQEWCIYWYREKREKKVEER